MVIVPFLIDQKCPQWGPQETLPRPSFFASLNRSSLQALVEYISYKTLAGCARSVKLGFNEFFGSDGPRHARRVPLRLERGDGNIQGG
jgi:hypothetical protein